MIQKSQAPRQTANPKMSSKAERLQKVLAAAGYGSRRQCEEFIKEGRVQVNSNIAQIGQKVVADEDSILFDGQPINEAESLAYYLLNKPTGVVSSLEAQGSYRSIDELVTVQERVYPVGRLDADSEGLILMTNDGDLTYRLTHPSFEHEKEYLVWLDRLPDKAALTSWRDGLYLPGLGESAPALVEIVNPKERQLRVIMHEGMNRQIRVTAQTLGLEVLRLKRIRLGSLTLGNLKPGSWRPLKQREIQALRSEVGLMVSQEVGE